MKANKKTKKQLGMLNDAVRNAHAAELAVLFRDRARSNASGVHVNAGDKRARTRSAAKVKAMREFA